MDKELLNKILPYCGYGLKAIYEDDIVNVCISSSGTNRINTERLLTKSSDGTYHYKPVLFPPDCLRREIETEYGKEVPLIELAKIAYNYSSSDGWVISSGFGAEDQSDCLYPMSKLMFGYDSYKRFIKYFYHKDQGKEYIPMDNQWELFQYLYSRHIAFNLNPDDYVSVESLEKNPYAI